ncbi:haloacid dehalogenase [Moniliophthora roreri]|uniref:Haloacid dehalogenase n=1 Tax=Moniliophthora roreri TaxID=221103 RepID=A0A0W0FTF0_MONRR|nr:haloacid dehalogenase [Moniliophthora roreri]
MSSNTSQLKDFEILFFDVYGTLCDWETGICDGLKPLLSRFSISSKWTRKEALEAFTAIEADLQAKHPQLLYRDLLAKAHEVMEERLKAASGKPVDTTTLEGDPNTITSTSGSSSSNADSSSPNAHVLFGSSIKDWPLFPDTVDALQKLSQRYKLCVLSNVDRASFSYTLAKLSGDSSHPERYQPPSKGYWFPQEAPGSKSPFTLILTAQDVGTYKPDPNGFECALKVVASDPQHFGTGGDKDVKERVLWVAQSLFHDVHPVSKIGVQSAWIDRKGAVMGLNVEPVGYSWKADTLGELAEMVEKESK